MLFLAGAAQGWTPTVFPRFDPAQNPQAVDFSSAGCRIPAGGYPWLRETTVLGPPPAGDSTVAIQDALDAAGADGGGTVRLSAGIWKIQPTGLVIDRDNVRLEGVGAAATTLHVQGTNHPQTTALRFGRSPSNTFVGSQSYPDSWVRQAVAGDTEHLTVDALSGSDRIYTSNPALAPGAPVIVTGTPTAAWIAQHAMTDVWTTDMDYPASLRRIAEVFADGYRLDMPVRYAVRTRDAARIFPATKLTSYVSLARLTILYDRHPGTDFESGTADLETGQATAVQFINVENGLMENVEMPLLPSRGVEIAYSRFVTVRDCAAYESQNRNGFWNGYQFFIWGCDNLIDTCFAQGGRHNYSILMAMSHGNVISNCRSRNPRYPSDFHMHLSHSNLIDGFDGEGDRYESLFRPFGSPILHGVSGTENVFWNVGSDQPQVVWSTQHGTGYVVGTRGPGAAVLHAIFDYTGLPVDHAEGIGLGDTMEPPSLFEYQKSLKPGAARSVGWELYP